MQIRMHPSINTWTSAGGTYMRRLNVEVYSWVMNVVVSVIYQGWVLTAVCLCGGQECVTMTNAAFYHSSSTANALQKELMRLLPVLPLFIHWHELTLHDELLISDFFFLHELTSAFPLISCVYVKVALTKTCIRKLITRGVHKKELVTPG